MGRGAYHGGTSFDDVHADYRVTTTDSMLLTYGHELDGGTTGTYGTTGALPVGTWVLVAVDYTAAGLAIAFPGNQHTVAAPLPAGATGLHVTFGIPSHDSPAPRGA